MVFQSFLQHNFSYIGASAPIHAFLEIPFTRNLQNFLSKPLGAFPHNNGHGLERNELCSINYHQSKEKKWPSQGLHQCLPVLKSCPYSPTILKNVLCLVLQVCLYLAALECNTTSDWLNHMV